MLSLEFLDGGRRLPLRLLGAAAALIAVLLAIVLWLLIAGDPKPKEQVVSVPLATATVAGAKAVAPAPNDMKAADANIVLAPAPDLALTEVVRDLTGPIPAKGVDGRVVWKAYARPFDSTDRRPRVAFILYNLGTSATDTDTVIRTMPPAVTLSFMPYRRRLAEWIPMARAAGHEVLLDLPMEPVDMAHDDPGPKPLLVALDQTENIGRLQWMMSQSTGYVGMLAYMGGRFESARKDLLPIMDEITRRGLLYVDNRASQQSVAPLLAAELATPFAGAARVFDSDLQRPLIERRFSELEELAKQTGGAVGIGEATPVLREALLAWTQSLSSRGIALAPVSAVVTIPSPPQPATPTAAASPAAASAAAH